MPAQASFTLANVGQWRPARESPIFSQYRPSPTTERRWKTRSLILRGIGAVSSEPQRFPASTQADVGIHYA